MNKVPVTVVIITKNEEKRLPDCLRSVAWADEIIVLDDDSTDRTVELAKQAGCKVFRRTMENEGRHRNYGISLASHDWVLSLDADERVTPELAEEIKKVCETKDDPNACYSMPIKTFIGSEWIEGAGYYPACRDKLLHKNRFRYKEERVHPPVSYQGTSGRLKGDLLHYSARDFEHWISKFNRETSLEAEKWYTDGRKTGPWRTLRKAVSRFLKNYFQKDGIKHGYTGFVMSNFHALYQIVTYAKYRELKRNENKK